MMMMMEHGVANGMVIGRGNRIAMRKPARVSLEPPKVPHDLTWEADD
jgi:hypothetical protein